MNTAQEIAQALLDIKAIKLSPQAPFTWASGMKSPIYCDNRLIISHPETRQQVMKAMIQLVKEKYPEVEVIAGTATAGIPHAAILAHELNLPMVYVRSSAKDHGMGNQIEGQILPGQKVLMIEDLISTGGSVIKAAQAVEASQGQVLGVLAIFNYQLQAGIDNFRSSGFKLDTLSNYQALIAQAIQDPAYQPYQTTLEQWYKDPQAWSENYLAHN